VGVGAGRGISPVLGPPDGQEEEVDGVGGHAVVVGDCQVVQSDLVCNSCTKIAALSQAILVVFSLLHIMND
jgi:hypothetical protein